MSEGHQLHSSSIALDVHPTSATILNWLHARPEYPKFFWSSRDGDLTVAGVGEAANFTASDSGSVQAVWHAALDLVSSIKPAPFLFAGGKFNPAEVSDSLWNSFPPFAFWLPAVALVVDATQAHIRSFTPEGTEPHQLEALAAELMSHTRGIFRLRPGESFRALERIDEPSFGGWSTNIGTVLDQIKGSGLNKVVLARRTSLYLNAPIDPFEYLIHLSNEQQGSYSYLYAPSKHSAWLGVSPERLVQLKGGRVTSDALAGTVGRGHSRSLDDLLQGSLMASRKNRSEHEFVVAELKEKFSVFADEVQAATNPEVATYSDIHHLRTTIAGKLKPEVPISKIVQTLHPTSAVCGIPQSTALNLISKLEPFSRGWYAGPIGIISRDFADFAVGIRSMLLTISQAFLFAGAGIVQGSNPDEEWQELETKIASVFKGIDS